MAEVKLRLVFYMNYVNLSKTDSNTTEKMFIVLPSLMLELRACAKPFRSISDPLDLLYEKASSVVYCNPVCTPYITVNLNLAIIFLNIYLYFFNIFFLNVLLLKIYSVKKIIIMARFKCLCSAQHTQAMTSHDVL